MENRTDSAGTWSGKSRGGGLGYRIFLFLIKHAGLRVSYTVLAFVAMYFIPFAPKATAAIWDFYRRRLGKGMLASAFLIYRHYYTFGQTLIDKMAIAGGLEEKYTFGFENYREGFTEIMQSGSGMVMIGAHIGSWEAAASSFAEYADRLDIVMYDAEYASIKKVLDSGMRRDYKVIAVNGDMFDTVISIKKALDGGEAVCFQGDRYLEGEQTCSHGFMGGNALFPRGPFMIAARMRKPVVFYFAMREKGRKYRFHFIRCAEGLTEKEILDRYVGCLEGFVRRYPSQWFNFYRFWS